MLTSQIIGIIAIIIGFIGYIPYLRDMFLGKTKPHLFTWIIWVLLEFTSFGIQIKNGAGAGAWVTLLSALISFIVVIYGFKYRKLNIKKTDWICFSGALLSLVLWLLLDAPILASIFLILTDIFAFIPTFRKTWHSPYEETILVYAIASLKFVVAFFAFEHFTLANVLYPVYLVIANGSFVIFALYRRNVLK